MSDSEDKKQDAKTTGASGLTSLMNFVPSAYYDLIARICPGMAFWIALSFKMSIFPEISRKTTVDELTGTTLIILIILSYVSGIAFTGFCIVWDWISIPIITTTKLMKSHLGLDQPDTPFTSKWKMISRKIDEVIKESDGAGKVLTKAMAEVTLCQNLLTGLVVLLFIGFFSEGESFFDPRASSYRIYYLLIFGALFLSMIFRQIMFLGRVKDLHELYAPKTISFPKTSNDRLQAIEGALK
jgi:hypothetical protein